MKYLKYLKIICIHKWYVFIECCKEGIIWQGIIHDMSKFSPSEFVASAWYYFGDRSNSVINEGIKEKYQEAWLHHKGHNKHHWEYWVDWNSDTGEYILSRIPFKYLFVLLNWMCCCHNITSYFGSSGHIMLLGNSFCFVISLNS